VGRASIPLKRVQFLGAVSLESFNTFMTERVDIDDPKHLRIVCSVFEFLLLRAFEGFLSGWEPASEAF
jgi:hypothetical protein